MKRDTSDLTPAQAAYLEKLNQPVLLRGDYFRATMVAYDDFSHNLRRNAEAATLPETQNKPLAEWLSKIEDFDIDVSQTKDSFILDFRPTVRGSFGPVFGGGARYVVDRISFKITSRTFSK